MADKSFADDLSEARSDISADVSGILQVVKERHNATVSPQIKETQQPKQPRQTETATAPPAERSSRQPRSTPRPQTDEGEPTENVTARIRTTINRRITEAALRQKLKKAKPDTRQGILDVAAAEWMDRHGY